MLLKTESTSLDKAVLYYPVAKKKMVEKELVPIFHRAQGKRSEKASVKMLAKTDWGLEFEQFEFDPVSIKRNNYNEDFWDFDAHLTKHLTERNGGWCCFMEFPELVKLPIYCISAQNSNRRISFIYHQI